MIVFAVAQSPQVVTFMKSVVVARPQSLRYKGRLVIILGAFFSNEGWPYPSISVRIWIVTYTTNYTWTTCALKAVEDHREILATKATYTQSLPKSGS